MITNKSLTLNFQKLLLILSVSLGLNFIPNILFPVYDVAPMAGVTFFLILYILSRGFTRILNTFIRFWRTNHRFKVITLPIIFLLVYELIRYPLNPNYSLYIFIILPVLITVFFLFLIDIYSNFCNSKIDIFLNKYVKSYFIMCNIIIVSSALIFFLMKLGIVNMNEWTNVSIYGTDFQIRQDYLQGGTFVNPYYVTVIYPSVIKFSNFFGEYGTFSGWSYEPHIACFFITPGFLLINYYYKKRLNKYLLILSYLLFYILSLSLTTIIGLIIISILYLLSLRNKTTKQKTLIYIFLIAIIGFGSLIMTYFNEAIAFSEAKYQTESTTTSSYGMTWDYIFSPKSFFGNGLLMAPNTGEVSLATGSETKNITSGDIGIIPFLNFFWFYIIIFYYSIQTVFIKNQFGFLGLLSIYIIIHTIKFPFHVFCFPLIFFIYFIICIVPKK